jgi:hypothetical protein
VPSLFVVTLPETPLAQVAVAVPPAIATPVAAVPDNVNLLGATTEVPDPDPPPQLIKIPADRTDAMRLKLLIEDFMICSK